MLKQITTWLLMIILLSLSCAAFSFSNERVYGDGLTELYWEFTPFTEDTASYKEQWTPRIDNFGCEDAKIEMYELLPVTYNEETCEPTYKEVCEDTLIKGDAKNSTEDHYESTCHQEVTGESCESTPRTVYEKYDVTKTDMLFVKDAKLVVHATRKARTGFQACDLNFKYDNGNTTVDSADFGKAWWSTTWNYKTPVYIANTTPSNVTSGNTEFPIKIVFNASTIDYTRTSSDGRDLRCLNSYENTSLPLFIEVWNTSNISIIHCLTNLSNETNTTLYIYYNATGVSTVSNYTQVFGDSYFYGMNKFWQDSSNYSNNLSVGAGTPTWQTGSSDVEKWYGETYFDGTNDRLDSGSNTLSSATDVVVAGWFNATSAPGVGTIYNPHGNFAGGAWSQGQWALHIRGSAPAGFDCVSHDGTSVREATQGAAITANIWYHVVCIYDATGRRNQLYINGNYVNYADNDGAVVWSNNAYRIGEDGSGNGDFPGEVDEIRIFKRNLSVAYIRLLYDQPDYSFGSAELSVIGTNLGIGVLNSSWVNDSVLDEGQEFRPFANYSYAANGSSVTNVSGTCKFNLTNVSVEYYSSTGTNATVCTGGACTYTNKTGVWTADTSLFNTDVYRFRICRSGSATPDAYYSVGCVGGAGTNGNIPSSVVPLCSAGWLNYTVTSAGCVGAGSQVNVSIWTTANTLAKSYKLIDDSGVAGYGFPGFDRYRDETNTQMVWNDTMQLWHSVLWYEHYKHASYQLNVTCNDSSTIQNQTASVNFTIVNKVPVILWDFIEDWVSGIVSPFTNGIDMRYPLSGSVNTSVLVIDDDPDSFSINLTFENGTYIYGHTGSGSPGVLSWDQSNFSVAANYLGSLLGYYLVVTVNDTYGEVVSGSRLFYAGNDAPVSAWSNASGGAYAYSPSFNYSCTDLEGADSVAFIYINGTLNSTVPGRVSGAGYEFAETYADGSYNLSVSCFDTYSYSSNATLIFSKSTTCVQNVSGIKDGGRYLSTELPVTMNCTNGVAISSCSYSINGYESTAVTNCSAFNLSLEVGSNRLWINLTDAGGLSTGTFYQVFAKDKGTGLASFIVLFVLLGVTIFVFWMYKLSGSIMVVGLLAVFGVFLIGYYLLAFSLLAAILVFAAGLCMFLWLILT